MKHKATIASIAGIMSLLAIAIERPSAEWNNLVARCAIETYSIADSMRHIDMMSQPIFTSDVVKAISSFPNPHMRNANIKYAAKELVANASKESQLATKNAIIEALPQQEKFEISMMLSKMCNENMPQINVVHGISGSSDVMAALATDVYSSTNMQSSAELFASPASIGASYPQSDIGLLRVPRPALKDDRKKHDLHPQPYDGQ